MLRMIVASLALGFVAGAAHGEEKTCAVQGMHCESCKEMVEGKVCEEGKYKTCDVKILNAKKELGQIHMITKEANDKIDEKSIGAMLTDAGYTMQSCKMGKAKSMAKAADSKG